MSIVVSETSHSNENEVVLLILSTNNGYTNHVRRRSFGLLGNKKQVLFFENINPVSEKKLSKLKGDSPASSSPQEKEKTRRRMLDDLMSSRADHVSRFLSTEGDRRLDFDSGAEPIDPNSPGARLLKFVAPEKLALTSEELRALVKADELDARHSGASDASVEERESK